MTCPYTWRDGWGEHACLRAEHEDRSHHCECDATAFEIRETYGAT